MNESPLEQGPYAAPAAALEMALPPGPSGPGWFWGIVFALPVLTLAGLLVFVVAITPEDKGGMAHFAISAVALSLGLLGGIVVVNGVLTARRNGSRILGSSAVMGGIAVLVFTILPDLVGWMYQPPEVSDGFWTWSNARDAAAIWLGASSYALFQGLLIRWSLKRQARRARA